MKQWFWKIAFGSFCLILSQTGYSRVDSIGVKVVNGKAYVLHKVDPGENLTQLSRRYGSSVANISSINAMDNEVLKVGQVLRIPLKSGGSSLSLRNVTRSEVNTATSEVNPGVNKTLSGGNPQAGTQHPDKQGLPQGPIKHKVQKGETLYAISRKYQVSVQQIQTWNNLTDAGIQIGQTLIVSSPDKKTKPVVTETTDSSAPVVKETPVIETPVKETAPKPKETISPVRQVSTLEAATPKEQKRVVHTVTSGETLFGVARKYGVEVSDIKKLNKLTDTGLQIGQELVISEAREEAEAVTPPNPNQGKSLQEMMDEASGEEATQAKEMKVLTATESPLNLPPDADVEDYKDDYSGDNYKRVEERGKAGLIEDFSTDQTKFYAFHKYLPTGSYIRVDYPEKSQSILVEVINSLPMEDNHVVLLTAKCMDYLRMSSAGGEVTLRYVVPIKK